MAISRYEFQSRILPIIFNAELQCKKKIAESVMLGRSLIQLRYVLSKYIESVKEKLDGIEGTEPYVRGLKIKVSKMLQQAEAQKRSFVEMLNTMMMVAASSGDERMAKQVFKADTPQKFLSLGKETIDLIIDASDDFETDNGYDVWAMRKGSPNPKNYAEKLNAYIDKLAAENIVTSEDGKKSQSIWQRAELDVRHDEQMRMVSEVSSKFRYAYTSTHPNCSERCEKWQGKLFDLHAEHSELSNHRMKDKVDGRTVYCFKEIERIKDKYGYENNIINGFNCRHHLVGYESGDLPPREYSKKEIEKEYAKDQYMRIMEREIRFLKQKLAVTISGSKKKELTKKIKESVKHYKEFCERNGYAFYHYRIGE